MLKRNMVIIPALLGLVACGGSSSDVRDACNELSDADFSCDAMLNDLVEKSAQPLATEFKTKMQELNTAVDAYCSNPVTTSALSAAQDAWKAAMVPLQKMQTMDFGPNASGDNKLLSFYDWETADPYDIDIAIAKNYLFEAVTLPTADNEKDLVALEYILFDIGAIQSYDSNENSNVEAWRTDPDADIQADRCDYAQLVSEELKTRAASFEAEWNNFDLASISNSKQAAANEVVQGFFYADKQIKDAKIKAALPQETNGKFDASKLESQYANVSKEHLINNLNGLKLIFNADDGVGIDDYLIAAGQADVATDINNEIDSAIANLEAIDGSLFDAVNDLYTVSDCMNDNVYTESDAPITVLCVLPKTLVGLTDLLKEDLVMSTAFTKPASVSGDND